MKRRTFLLTGTGIAGTLVLGWAVTPPKQKLLPESASLPLSRGDVALNGWLTIAPEGTVSIAVPRSEMGRASTRRYPCSWPRNSVAIGQALA